MNTAAAGTAAPVATAEKDSAAALQKDDGKSGDFMEQEAPVFEEDKPRRAAPLVVAAAVVLVAAAIYFVAIKKPHKDQTMLQVNSTPEGAMIYFDGYNKGKLTNYTFSNVTPGFLNVRLTKSGYEAFFTNVIILKDQTVVINATLTPSH